MRLKNFLFAITVLTIGVACNHEKSDSKSVGKPCPTCKKCEDSLISKANFQYDSLSDKDLQEFLYSISDSCERKYREELHKDRLFIHQLLIVQLWQKPDVFYAFLESGCGENDVIFEYLDFELGDLPYDSIYYHLNTLDTLNHSQEIIKEIMKPKLLEPKPDTESN